MLGICSPGLAEGFTFMNMTLVKAQGKVSDQLSVQLPINLLNV